MSIKTVSRPLAILAVLFLAACSPEVISSGASQTAYPDGIAADMQAIPHFGG